MNALELRRKSDAIQAGLFLAQHDVFVNAPDIAQVSTHVSFQTAPTTITVASTPIANAAIIGVSSSTMPAVNVLLSDLANPKYRLRLPILVRVTQNSDSGEWVALFPEAEIARSGESWDAAVNWLRDSLVDMYELYKKREKDLGPLPKRQLSALEKYLVAKSHSHSRGNVHR